MGTYENINYKYLREICSYLLRNYDKPITLEQMAEDLPISSRKIQRIIHEHLQAKIKDILNTIRIYKIIEQIKDNNENITISALISGFTEVRLFQYWWKKCMNIPLNHDLIHTDTIENNFKKEYKSLLIKILRYAQER